MQEQPSQGFSKKVWYILASIISAIFIYIVAPIAVDSIKQRMAGTGPQPEATKPVQVQSGGLEESVKESGGKKNSEEKIESKKSISSDAKKFTD